jgi:hypothetical protein
MLVASYCGNIVVSAKGDNMITIGTVILAFNVKLFFLSLVLMITEMFDGSSLFE